LHMGTDIYEDRDLEVTSFLSINHDEQIAAVNHELATRGASSPLKQSA